MIYHALAALCQFPAIKEVYVALSAGDEWWTHYDWSDLGPRLNVLRCGGATRAETVLNALEAMRATSVDSVDSLDANGSPKIGDVADDDWVLVHDAVRPCLSHTMIGALLDELKDDPIGGLLAVPLADTLKRAGSDQRISATKSRDGLWQAQTPQMFRYRRLRDAMSAAMQGNVGGQINLTDEASALEAAGLSPRLVQADASNFKITYPADLQLAELILRGRRKGD